MADTYLTLYKKPKKGAATYRIPYKSKVKVYGKISPRTKGKWVKVVYKSKTYYKWMVRDIVFVAKGFDFDYYEQAAVGPIPQKVVDDAIYIYKNKKTTYSHKKPQGTLVNGKMCFDCSGFVSYIVNGIMQDYIPNYKASGSIGDLYDINALYTDASGPVKAQVVCKGKPDFGKLLPGDIVYFSETSGSSSCTHCGIYIGNKEFIHSTKQTDGVSIMPLDSEGYESIFLSAKRIVPDNAPEPIKEDRVLNANAWVYDATTYGTEDQITRLSTGDTVKLLYTAPLLWTDAFDSCYVEYADGKYGFMKSTLLDQVE